MTIEERAEVARIKASDLEDRAAQVRARANDEVYRKLEATMRGCAWIVECDGLDKPLRALADDMVGSINLTLNRMRSAYRPRVLQNGPVQHLVTGEKEAAP
jgi:hypothetical protein